MKKNSVILCIMVAIALLLVPIFSGNGEASEKGEFIFATPAPIFSEAGGEAMGLSIFLETLFGATQLHPDLKGKFNLKIVDRGILVGTQEEALTALNAGGIQMTYSGPRFLEQLAPEWKLISIPGLVTDWNHFERVMQTQPWRDLQNRIAKEKNVTINKWLFNIADMYIFTAKGPVRTMEDLKGQKIRFPGGEAYSRVLRALGAAGVSLPYTEVVTALQTHMVDGLVTEMSGALDFFKLPKYTKYCIHYPLSMELICWTTNTKWWESLDQKERTAINDIFERVDVTKFYKSYMDRLTKVWANDPKLKLLELSKEEKQRWAKTIRSAGLEMVSDIDPKYLKAVDSTR
jgi:TRAP-type C4-dicarboxylate transport system substrate-binding protein